MLFYYIILFIFRFFFYVLPLISLEGAVTIVESTLQ
jgi:hypothetical protein